MISSFNISSAMSEQRKRILAKLELVGAFVETEAKKNAPKDSGYLADHIDHEVIPARLAVRISTNAIYGAIQELGGVITPDKAGALTIPVHPDAKGKRASDFPDLIFIKREGANPLLVRKVGEKQFDIMFVLVKSAEIPAHPYLRPAVYENQDKIIKIFQL